MRRIFISGKREEVSWDGGFPVTVSCNFFLLSFFLSRSPKDLRTRGLPNRRMPFWRKPPRCRRFPSQPRRQLLSLPSKRRPHTTRSNTIDIRMPWIHTDHDQRSFFTTILTVV